MASATFQTNQAGTYVFQAQWDQLTSNTIEVNVRADTSYPLLSLPVIFHIMHEGEPVGTGANLAYDSMVRLLEDTNHRLRQTANTVGDNDHPSGVDLGIQLRLAVYDTVGQPLAEPGVIRHKESDTGIYNLWQLTYSYGWNPSEYINVFIGKHGDRSFGEGATTFAQDTFPGLSTLRDEHQAYNTTTNLDYRHYPIGVYLSPIRFNHPEDIL